MTDQRLHGPEFCPRVCSGCVCDDGRSRHHWIEASADPDDPPEEYFDNDVRLQVLEWDRTHGTEHALGFYACKHCEAWAECDYIWDMEEAAEEEELNEP